MIIAFYKVDNSLNYDRHSFDYIRDNSEEIKRQLSLLPDEELKIYDMNSYGYGNMPSPNMADFEDDYNDEILDGGWWCIIING